MWRWLRPALAAIQYPGEHHEPRAVALLILVIGLVLVLFGFFPGLSAYLPLHWVESATMAVPG